VKLALLSDLNAERAARRACIIVTDLASGEQRLIRAADLSRLPLTADPLAGVLAEALRTGRSGIVTGPAGEELFLTVSVPPVRVIVTGAVHISQAMVPMAAALGLDLSICDPRTAFASPERFPGVRLVAKWPDEALRELGGLDAFTALVALTHDPKIDDPALKAALDSGCFYIGALGSRKTHARRLERLAAEDFSETTLARIHAPIGLDIGAVSPAEIALSILGEIVATLRSDRRRPAGTLA
jgi:xanthine dehydrogenase accessory factor